jgi:hypothetical protein
MINIRSTLRTATICVKIFLLALLFGSNGKGKGKDKGKGKAVSTVTGLEWPRGFQEVKVPRFHDNGTGW